MGARQNCEHQIHHVKGYHAFEHRPPEHHLLIEHGTGEDTAFDHTKILHSIFPPLVPHAHEQQDEV
jgi:hypothetical protein